LHVFAGLQLWLLMQGMHMPALQTAVFTVAPQSLPFAAFPLSAQVIVPVPQAVLPVLHVLVGLQLFPAMQVTHIPALQTLLGPQVLPFPRVSPVSVQVIAGAQTWLPVWQGLDGVQVAPTVHAVQTPSSQTWPVPHMVPLATFPVSVQTGAPVSHVIAAVRQGFAATVQLAPAWHATQAPVALQTLFGAQVVPAATSVPLSLHTGVPLEQTSEPWWQAFVVGTHEASIWQTVHTPSRQTMSEPQLVPLGRLPAAAQTGAPVSHAIAPVWHVFPVREQAVPAAHGTHVPLLHTMSSPQTVPFTWSVDVAVHEGPVAAQTVCPR
jgi:hypothetical protein